LITTLSASAASELLRRPTPGRFGPSIDWARDVFAFAAQRTAEVRLAQVAGSLTFTTVLSIVPLLAVALSLFSAFPLFNDYRSALEQLLLRELLPDAISSVILRYLNDFTAKAASLTTYGLIFLLVTALLMIFTVDRALNDIWNVRARRALVPRILTYWALLTLGPLVLGASLNATSMLLSSRGRAATGLAELAIEWGPFVLGGMALAALYVVVPNRKVAWRDALIGGFVASAAGELMTAGFAAYIRTGTISGIYGAFSAVPLFLLWVYLSWFALLFGAAIAATLPMLRGTRFADEQRAGNRFITAVSLLRRLPLAQLARDVRTFDDAAERLLLDLEHAGYVSRLDGAHAGKWLLTCDPAEATLTTVFALYAVDPANSLLARDDELSAWMNSGLAAGWLNTPLATLFALPDQAAR
jgi:membrane protein